MDRLDKEILDALQYDDTLSVAQVAERISISKTACWRRIKNLTDKKIIKQRVAMIEPAAVNLSLTVFISIRTNKHNDEWVTQFREVLESLPQILEVYRMSGDLDYLPKAVVCDMPDYDKLYQQLIQADLFDVTSNFVMEEIKHTTELPI